jgi:hypothetical protein
VHPGVQWDIFVTQNDMAYTGALSVELPLTLGQFAGPPAAIFAGLDMEGTGGDDTNGTGGTTWYYNETTAASGVLLWNISDPVDANDHTQNNGDNPFTMSVTDGLEVDAANRRLFAALGSTVGMTDALSGVPGKQIPLLHVATSDGVLSWTDAIIGENGVQYSGISGSADSLVGGDTNGNGYRNATTGAIQDAVGGGDISSFRILLTPITGVATYNAMFPGLNGHKRGDANGSGSFTGGDVTAFRAAIVPGVPPGSGAVVGGGEVPEPTSFLLLVLGGALACLRRGRR